ncbi:hypothetical protein NPS01_23030 [Nocardioides psychrotolerans]|uniref:Uncharacterized protein n=1 Tax=Nocardioides psychrotolerans TaxID=1005945 RepID=A0A1I3I1L7_9ACTN|nr:hypothetical protein [Nocardioides psychrotolerans]GEP38640.1 hypothetical protein NPS01_23030 [Nocardioides psychrotolerans]SFI41831.1 hypothetical protein SAMN05216561_10881 [Nocardioides psychrotolerans]
MRSSSRLIASFLAIFALGALSLAGTASADVSEKARQPHKIINLKAGEYGNTGKFFAKGQVTTYKNKFVKLQKKKCDKCSYKPVSQKKTTGTGKFLFNFDGPRGSCFRVLVPGTSQYKPAYRPVGCIVPA